MDAKDAIIIEANKRLLALDLNINSNQPAMKSIITDLGLECDGNSAEKLRAVLEPVKVNLLIEEEETAATAETERLRLIEEEETNKEISGNFIMTVMHLSWGKNKKNHFFSKNKPLINAKVMGTFAPTLKIWLDAGWVEKGSYKK